ncbi:serine hydrolase [Micromonospora sp. WMMA1363]|uniref:serine hydrolase n=1 Tax=Micromonospora sp. WMMA1363 TaxID=3053985 RepID=UPI00259CA6BE|nr:serine hydrolase [Micromonospora sp. WMMA1363]MDM4719899.1 serine hydrolase [Micromonospora sp. WMMA1363]
MKQTNTVVAALIAALLLPPVLAPATGAAHRPPQYCASTSHPELADRLSRELTAPARGRDTTLAFAIWDEQTGLTCAHHPTMPYQAASIIKVSIMTGVLRRAQEENRRPTPQEEAEVRSMIVDSDDQATTTLYNSLGPAFMKRTLEVSGMDDSRLGPDDRWGRTQVTAADAMKQLDVYSNRSDVLSPEHRADGLRLMGEVAPDQRWGTPHGAPHGVTVYVKNGWAQFPDKTWQINSLGIFTATGRRYQMAVLTDQNPTETAGIATIEQLAQHVHHALE